MAKRTDETGMRDRHFDKGGPVLIPSLSIILPVHNCETTIAGRVEWLLDSLLDLTPRFEVLLVDDGSTVQTEEVLRELAREFPQIRVLRHSRQLGHQAAVRSGARQARGEMILLNESPCEFSTVELRNLWQTRAADDSAPACPASQSAQWQRRDNPSRPSGMKLIRREELDQFIVGNPTSEPTSFAETPSPLWFVARRRRHLRSRNRLLLGR